MKKLRWIAAAIVIASWAAPAFADSPPLSQSGNLQASGTSSSCVSNTAGSSGSCVVIHCPNGQSSAVAYVPSGVTGTATVYTAPDIGNAPGTYGLPDNITAPNSSTYTQSLSSFPGKLYVTLGGEQWVELVLTTASSGNATGTVTCSSAVARAASAALPSPLNVAQASSSAPAASITENATPSTADVLDIIGSGVSGTCATAFTAMECVDMASTDNIGIQVIDNTATGCGICISAKALGDANYDSLGTQSGYGVDVVYTGGSGCGTGPTYCIGPMFRGNNGYFGSSSLGLAPAMAGMLLADAGSTATDLQIKQEKTSGVTMDLDQDFSVFTGTMLKIAVGLNGSSSTNPTPTQGSCSGCDLIDGYNNSSGSSVLEFHVDGSGNITNHGTLVTTGGITGGSLTTTGITQTKKLQQNAACQFACTCTMVSATSCTATLAVSYTTSLCYVTDQTNPIAGKGVLSSFTLTITAASSNSDTWAGFCVGNPS